MRSRVPINSKRGEKGSPTPTPIVLPGVDITQASVQVMSLGGNTTSGSSAATSLSWRTDYTVNTWANATLVTNASFPLQFAKDANGMVYCKGSLTLNMTANPTITGLLLTFPAGCRPGGSSTGISGNKFQGEIFDGLVGQHITIYPDGRLYCDATFSAGFGPQSYYLNFGSLSWFAEN